MKYEVIRQGRKQESLGLCLVNIDGAGVLDAFGEDNQRCLRLESVRIQWMAADGIMVVGYLHTQRIRRGVEVYELTEVYLRYATIA